MDFSLDLCLGDGGSVFFNSVLWGMGGGVVLL